MPCHSSRKEELMAMLQREVRSVAATISASTVRIPVLGAGRSAAIDRIFLHHTLAFFSQSRYNIYTYFQRGMTMASIVKQRVGKHVYLYESVSYRNADGEPRNRRIPIGKIDAGTGQPVYKPEYLARMAAQGTPVQPSPNQPVFSADDVRHSTIRSYGAWYLLENIAAEIGLTKALREAIPSRWRELFMLACYLLMSGDPFLYFESWLEETEHLPVGDLSSQRISELLLSLTSTERGKALEIYNACGE